jgi:hypothetical protein
MVQIPRDAIIDFGGLQFFRACVSLGNLTKVVDVFLGGGDMLTCVMFVHIEGCVQI